MFHPAPASETAQFTVEAFAMKDIPQISPITIIVFFILYYLVSFFLSHLGWRIFTS
jgi:hypothetical protein